ncbi:MAG: excinuclease ABC subunit UvrB [Candidatus Gracilibacteria bacterium]|nr:excinuclease ABC subunit UvrB [Candidatus Gracilibacteria bacterium]
MFKLNSPYQPTGDQPEAIRILVDSIRQGNDFQTLLGVTGSGKTFTMANIISELQRPALILAHNKTLAAQLAQEFKEFFPENAVHYFVSYYDYYQPEAYVVKTGAYIEKEATINEEIDRLRHAATESLLTRKDVIIVASVSCIYGIGEVAQYEAQCLKFEVGKDYIIENLIRELVMVQFTRSTADWKPGMFLVKGDILEIWPSSSESIIRLEFFGDTLDRITRIEHLTHQLIENLETITIFPAKHFVTEKGIIESVLPKIKHEMEEQVKFFTENGKLVEAERIKMRVEYDMEMLGEVGYVNGIENYSMYLGNRNPGEAPATLMEFFPDGFLTFVDESHITIPQIGGMYAGDRARKENLVGYGFRLPSAMENRPLKFDEFEQKIGQTIFVSATPSKYEAAHEKVVAEQVIRPTGLLDPEITIEDMEFMVDSLMKNIAAAKSRGERSLITTITKKSSEDLANYFAENGLKVRYLHSEIETIERLEILRDYRLGVIDVIVGVNLLREGLDLPETSFIGILDAEKIGFLRSKTSLLQIIGRAARNANGHVIMYSHGCKQSIAMVDAIAETNRRREVQKAYNEKHGVTPTTIISSVKEVSIPKKKTEIFAGGEMTKEKLGTYIKRLELEMDVAAANLDFERAAEIRDELLNVRKKK